jgi:hypothetical protein
VAAQESVRSDRAVVSSRCGLPLQPDRGQRARPARDARDRRARAAAAPTGLRSAACSVAVGSPVRSTAAARPKVAPRHSVAVSPQLGSGLSQPGPSKVPPAASWLAQRCSVLRSQTRNRDAVARRTVEPRSVMQQPSVARPSVIQSSAARSSVIQPSVARSSVILPSVVQQRSVMQQPSVMQLPSVRGRASVPPPSVLLPPSVLPRPSVRQRRSMQRRRVRSQARTRARA